MMNPGGVGVAPGVVAGGGDGRDDEGDGAEEGDVAGE